MRLNVSDAFIAALAAPVLYPALFITATFASGPIYVWNGVGNISWNGQTWTGLGSLLEVSPIEDGSTIEARNTTITLSGIDPNLLAEVLGEFLTGQPVTIYLGLFDGTGATGASLIPSPIVSFAGRMDQPTVTADEKTASIQIECESLLRDMNVPVPYRYTNQDQQLFHPSDQIFIWVNAIQSVPIYWNQLMNANGNP